MKRMPCFWLWSPLEILFNLDDMSCPQTTGLAMPSTERCRSFNLCLSFVSKQREISQVKLNNESMDVGDANMRLNDRHFLLPKLFKRTVWDKTRLLLRSVLSRFEFVFWDSAQTHVLPKIIKWRFVRLGHRLLANNKNKRERSMFRKWMYAQAGVFKETLNGTEKEH